MNIHHASLFPGLDGFARSLGVDLDISLAEQVTSEKARAAEDAASYTSARRR